MRVRTTVKRRLELEKTVEVALKARLLREA
jgi:hypothetical protein